jgi:hypothetical protein
MSDEFDELTGQGISDEDEASIAPVEDEVEEEVEIDPVIDVPDEEDAEEKPLSDEEEFYDQFLEAQEEYGDGSGR